MARLPNPQKNTRHNGAWDRYVRWLERVTSGKSMRSPYCHNYRSHSPKGTGKGDSVKSSPVNTGKTVTDPVCEMKLDPNNTRLVSTREGNKYYFCSEGCRKAFNEHPRKFLGNKTSRPIGIWGRYLARLEKISGGRPMRCH
jgi:Cu+-exporting ATPase